MLSSPEAAVARARRERCLWLMQDLLLGCGDVAAGAVLGACTYAAADVHWTTLAWVVLLVFAWVRCGAAYALCFGGCGGCLLLSWRDWRPLSAATSGAVAAPCCWLSAKALRWLSDSDVE